MIVLRTENDLHLMKAAFREFYFNHGYEIEVPDKIQNREFGFMGFNGAMRRHLEFSNLGGLIASLLLDTPSDVFSSNARYEFPKLPMSEKGWLGADLIFDIDVNDLNLKCKISHSYSVCSACAACYYSSSKICPRCGSSHYTEVLLLCGSCIKGLKKEVSKLRHFLVDEIGIDAGMIRTYFSGNNGFHLHVLDESYNDLNSQARADLAGYVMGVGILADSLGVRRDPPGDFYIKFPLGGLDYGWRKRVSDKLGISTVSRKKLTNLVREIGGIGQFRMRIMEIGKELGVHIDSQVTTDVHRVFRMPGTLNGKSGLTKMFCSDLDLFDPFDDACQLSEREVLIKIMLPRLKLRLKGQRFDLNQDSVRVPLFVAIYLISKGLAHVLEQHD
jgi:DNA primase small subunit